MVARHTEIASGKPLRVAQDREVAEHAPDRREPDQWQAEPQGREGHDQEIADHQGAARAVRDAQDTRQQHDVGAGRKELERGREDLASQADLHRQCGHRPGNRQRRDGQVERPVHSLDPGHLEEAQADPRQLASSTL